MRIHELGRQGLLTDVKKHRAASLQQQFVCRLWTSAVVCYDNWCYGVHFFIEMGFSPRRSDTLPRQTWNLARGGERAKFHVYRGRQLPLLRWLNSLSTLWFSSRSAMIERSTAAGGVSVRLSVRHTLHGNESKRMTIASCGCNHRVAQGLKFHTLDPRNTPLGLQTRLTAVGETAKKRKFSNNKSFIISVNRITCFD